MINDDIREFRNRNVSAGRDISDNLIITGDINGTVNIQQKDLQTVPYSIIEVNKSNLEDTLHRIAVAMHFHLVDENGQEIPFIPFNDYERAKSKHNLFLYGQSGNGKSRIVFEILKENIRNYTRVYIVSPKKVPEEVSRRVGLTQMTNEFTDKDAIVWDNFPDGLTKRDFNDARGTLEIISCSTTKNFFVALKPTYLELYQDVSSTVPEIYTQRIIYGKDKIIDIIRSYGKNSQFKELYQKYIEKDIDKVSEILWKKEPVPLIVLDYYKELNSKKDRLSKGSLTAVTEAEELPRLIEYYESQFKLLSTLEERRIDREFLLTVKLFYELKLARTIHRLEEYQREIFHSNPPMEPIVKLSTWIFSSGQYYAMYDVANEAIAFSDDIKRRIMDKLTENFSSLIPSDDETNHSFGKYFGKNIQFVPREAPNLLLPDHILAYVNDNRNFGSGLGEGIGEYFPSLDKELQEEALRIANEDKGEENDLSFAFVLGSNLGYYFSSIISDVQNQIFKMIEQNDNNFVGGISFGLGYSFENLSQEVQARIFGMIDRNNSLAFQVGFSNGFRYIFTGTSTSLQKEALESVKENKTFGLVFGASVGYIFSTKINTKVQDELFNRNDWISWGLGYKLGNLVREFDKTLQERLWQQTERSAHFSSGFGYSLGISLQNIETDGSNKEFKERLWQMVEKNKEFLKGLCQGIALIFRNDFRLSDEIKDEIWLRSRENESFAKTLAYAMGSFFSSYDIDNQNEILLQSEHNRDFGIILLGELGHLFNSLEKEIQKTILQWTRRWLKEEKYNELTWAFGLGMGILELDMLCKCESCNHHVQNECIRVNCKCCNEESHFKHIKAKK